MTAECIAAVRETTEDYEVIIVDNGSTPPIAKPYMGFVDVTLIRNETNLGFPAAVNQGVRAAKGDIIVLLNNDVIVTPGWGDRLKAHLERFSIVGPMTNFCAGRQRIQVPAYTDKDSLFEVAEEYAEGHKGLSIEANWIIGFCFAFRKSLFDEIGEFDESMWPSSGEEIDWCYRAKAAGHSVGIAQDVYIYHEGSVTFNEMDRRGEIDYTAFCEETSNLLKKKWGENFWNEQIVRGVMLKNGLRLNLGCGTFHLEGFVNVDMQEAVRPDLVCDILDLPYEEESVDEIYAGHILEHFDWKDGEVALHYWMTLLKPGGKISVCVPDIDYLMKEYVANPSPEKLRELNDLYIYSYCQVSPHKYAYSAALLKEAMETAGFVDLKRMPVDHPYFPTPVVWQSGYEAVRP
jgi:GT2 family glycosyltransferase/predicted SAM-dependent methyltransferase